MYFYLISVYFFGLNNVLLFLFVCLFVLCTFFILLRYRKRHTNEKQVGHINPVFGANAVQLGESPSPVRVDPIHVYSEISDLPTPSYENSNAAGGSMNTEYQRLEFRRSDHNYAQMLPHNSGRSPHYENAGYQSEDVLITFLPFLKKRFTINKICIEQYSVEENVKI